MIKSCNQYNLQISRANPKWNIQMHQKLYIYKIIDQELSSPHWRPFFFKWWSIHLELTADRLALVFLLKRSNCTRKQLTIWRKKKPHFLTWPVHVFKRLFGFWLMIINPSRKKKKNYLREHLNSIPQVGFRYLFPDYFNVIPDLYNLHAPR